MPMKIKGNSERRYYLVLFSLIGIGAIAGAVAAVKFIWEAAKAVALNSTATLYENPFNGFGLLCVLIFWVVFTLCREASK